MPAVAVTIFLSSTLLFIVQPILGKEILPWYGGSAGVWTSCLVFFQVLLLGGYAYAHALRAAPARGIRVWLHVLLLVCSALSLPIEPSATRVGFLKDPALDILVLLARTVGLPYFLLASTSPLLQSWLSRGKADASGPSRIYRLFALSNLGSLVGLLAYPFAVEPWISLAHQARIWSLAYATFALFMVGCSLRIGAWSSNPPAQVQVQVLPGTGRHVFWILLSSLGSVLLLSVTNHITQNIAAIPFLWIVPLALYLLSFVVCFDAPRWARRRYWLAPAMLGAGAMSWGLYAHQAVLSIYTAIPLFAAGLWCGCMLCHGELARSRPAAAHLTRFYLCVAFGGAMGGVLVGLLAPRVFDNYWETPLALVGLAVLGLGVTIDAAQGFSRRRWAWALVLGSVLAAVILTVMAGWPGPLGPLLDGSGIMASSTTRWMGILLVLGAVTVLQWMRLSGAIAFAALLCTLAYGWSYVQFVVADTEWMGRDFYGALRIQLSPPGPGQVRRLMHGVILHGSQYVRPDLARTPTTYYGPDSGIGRVFQVARLRTKDLRIASIGLGAGTLAAYAQAGDVFRVYELDPAVLDLARTRFSFLSASQALVQPVLGDARVSLQTELKSHAYDRAQMRFDVLSIDAFSSDAIPVHLLTSESFALYAEVIKPDGIIAFHTSNRYLTLAPVVAGIARAFGYRAMLVSNHPPPQSAESSSDWVLVSRDSAWFESGPIAEVAAPVAEQKGGIAWSDQYNDLFRILK